MTVFLHFVHHFVLLLCLFGTLDNGQNPETQQHYLRYVYVPSFQWTLIIKMCTYIQEVPGSNSSHATGHLNQTLSWISSISLSELSYPPNPLPVHNAQLSSHDT
jgi:hypothetical protein